MIKCLCQIWIFAISDEQLGTNSCLIFLCVCDFMSHLKKNVLLFDRDSSDEFPMSCTMLTCA